MPGQNPGRSSRGNSVVLRLQSRNRNRKLQTYKAPLKSQAQGTSLFTTAASNQRGFKREIAPFARTTTKRNRAFSVCDDGGRVMVQEWNRDRIS